MIYKTKTKNPQFCLECKNHSICDFFFTGETTNLLELRELVATMHDFGLILKGPADECSLRHILDDVDFKILCNISDSNLTRYSVMDFNIIESLFVQSSLDL